MTIVVTGGGSGGHITPLLAVANELKRQQPDISIVYIGQTGDNLGDIAAEHPMIDKTYTIRAGKLRRYHGEGLKQLLDIPTTLKNIRDVFYVLVGMVQSWRLLREIKPDVVFVKGGYVGVPVGLSAAVLGVPYITHDSDALPGLANRIIARWAKVHAVALPEEVYNYPIDKTVTVGVPIVADYEPVTPTVQAKYKKELGLPPESRLLFIIGGGLGAQRVNLAAAEAITHLLHEYSDLQVVHGVGKANEEQMQKLYTTTLSAAEQSRVVVKGYITDAYRYSGAADVIITRAGATQMAEFAVQSKACIVVPNPILTGGHQLKNAQYLQEKNAAVLVTEQELQDNPNVLAARASELLKDASKRTQLAKNLSVFARPAAAKQLATLLLQEVASNK